MFDLTGFLATITQNTHIFERIVSEAIIFKGERFPFKSPRLQSCLNYLEFARMSAGDLLRLKVMGFDARSNTRFVPSEHGATYTEPLTFIEGMDEKELILYLKGKIRETMYKLIDFDFNLHSSNEHYNGIYLWYYLELTIYKNQVIDALKKADQLLGLRLGEIQKERLPPSV